MSRHVLHAWRHPRADGAQGRCIGRTDLPTDPRRAKRQAHRMRAFARRHGLPRVVVTSPLDRSRAVGRWLARWGWRHRTDPALSELDFGDWDGRLWSSVPRDEIDAWCADFDRRPAGGGESVGSLLQRVIRFDPAEARLVVTHGGWLAAALWLRDRASAPPDASHWPVAPRHGQRTELTWPLAGSGQACADAGEPSTPPPATPCTLANVQRDFREWHRGRPRFAVWAIELAHPGVDARLRQLRDALGPRLLAPFARQPHITVHVCGFPVAAPTRADDFGEHELRAQAAAVARSGVAAFDVGVGAAFTFTSAACLAVHDDTRSLERLRRAWQAAVPGPDATPYVPHVTAGLYAGAWPLDDVRSRLDALPRLPALDVRVESLAWMCYESSRVAGPLSTLLRVRLDSGEVEVADPARLRAAFA